MQTSDLKVLDLTGSPRERGRIHGEELRSEIRLLLDHIEADVSERHGMSLTTFSEGFWRWSRHMEAVDRWAPDIAEEVVGIAEGAGLDQKLMQFHQLSDEYVVYGNYILSQRKKVELKCSAFAATEQNGQPAFGGQNMDIAPFFDGLQVLLKVAAEGDKPAAYVFSAAGMLGLSGMNDGPLGITCNTLMQLAPSPDGFPVGHMVRKVLQCARFDDAEGFLRRVRHASGQNYIISTPGKIGSFECSSESVAEFRPLPGGSRVCHTNHPFSNGDTARFEALKGDAARTEGRRVYHENSEARYASIYSRLGEPDKPLDLQTVKNALSAHDDPVHPVSRQHNAAERTNLIGFTAGSMIYELDPENPVLHLASGPPCVTEYLSFTFGEGV